VRLAIDKRIPVAAGMAGGSADAAAALRLAHRASGLGDEALLLEIAAGLGPTSRARSGPRACSSAAAASGSTSRRRRASRTASRAAERGAAVDRGRVRAVDGSARGPTRRSSTACDARVGGVQRGDLPPLANDLEPAARSLCPAIDEALAAARGVAAAWAMVSGSGPTVVGLFAAPDEARRAADYLNDAGRTPRAIATRPLTA
jgi:4-diphosphocytidyl-2-C-methyl-D-erythritol kinase